MSATNASRVSRFWASQNTSFESQGTELWESNIYIWLFSLKAVYNSCKLQGLLEVAKLFFMSSFTHTNIVFLFRDLPTAIVMFINVCYQMKCFSSDSFSFFRSRFSLSSYTFVTRWRVLVVIVFPFLAAGFANILSTFWFHVKFKQGIQRR